jgi:hypothetical protein
MRMVIRESAMMKAAIVMVVLSCIVACGGAPAQWTAQQPYTIISEQPDTASGGLVIDVKLSGQPARSDVRSIAESVIATRRSEHKKVVVRSFIDSASRNRIPFALSRLENGLITHEFSSQTETQKIPTH